MHRQHARVQSALGQQLAAHRVGRDPALRAGLRRPEGGALETRAHRRAGRASRGGALRADPAAAAHPVPGVRPRRRQSPGQATRAAAFGTQCAPRLGRPRPRARFAPLLSPLRRGEYVWTIVSTISEMNVVEDVQIAGK